MHPNSKSFGLYENSKRAYSKMKTAVYRTNAWAKGSDRVRFPDHRPKVITLSEIEFDSLFAEICSELHEILIKKNKIVYVGTTCCHCGVYLKRHKAYKDIASCPECKEKRKKAYAKEWRPNSKN